MQVLTTWVLKIVQIRVKQTNKQKYKSAFDESCSLILFKISLCTAQCGAQKKLKGFITGGVLLAEKKRLID